MYKHLSVPQNIQNCSLIDQHLHVWSVVQENPTDKFSILFVDWSVCKLIRNHLYIIANALSKQFESISFIFFLILYYCVLQDRIETWYLFTRCLNKSFSTYRMLCTQIVLFQPSSCHSYFLGWILALWASKREKFTTEKT